MATMRERLKKVFVGAKTARRHTIDYPSRSVEKEDPEKDVTINLRDYITEDPDLAAAMRKFVDNVLLKRVEIIKSPKSKVADSTVDSYNEQLQDVRFYRKLRNAVYSLLFSGNAFMEVKFRGKKLTELYNIDPDTIKIVTNDFGEVVEYTQQVAGADKVHFMPEEIIHLTMDHLDTSEWGMAFLKPLRSAMFRKSVAESYLERLVAKNKFAPLVKFKTIDSMQQEELMRIRSEIEITSTDADKIPMFNFGPDEDFEVDRIYTPEDFDIIIKYIEKQKEQINTILQVPPIIAGTVDNSNRSNSEIQARYVFYNTITAFQNLLSEELDYEMLRGKLKWNGVQTSFSEMDKGNEADIIKIAKSLKQDLNFTEEAIYEYMKENGFKIPKVDKLFNEIPEGVAENPDVVDKEAGTYDPNEAPSRQPRDKRGIPENEEKRLEDKQMGVSSNEN